MKSLLAAAFAALATSAFCSVLPNVVITAALPALAEEPALLGDVVPFDITECASVEQGIADLKRLNREYGIRQVILCGCPGLAVRLDGWTPSLARYERFGDIIAQVKQGVADTDLKVGWWYTPTLSYAKGGPFQHMVGGDGKEAIHSCCPLDDRLVADMAKRLVAVVSRGRPNIVMFEDDCHYGWQRNVKKFTCYCPLHLAAVGGKIGRAVSREELVAACESPTAANRAMRDAFAAVMRESMAAMGAEFRKAVDAISPDIRMGPSSVSNLDRDAGSLVDFARAVAGRGFRPFIRIAGSQYTSEASFHELIGHCGLSGWEYANLPADVERLQEIDTYPHNRFFDPECFVNAYLFLGAANGAESVCLYGTQYLDDPLEDTGYFDVLKGARAKLAAYRMALRGKRRTGIEVVRLVGTGDLRRYQTDRCAFGAMMMLSRFGFPFQQRNGGSDVKFLAGVEATMFTDDEMRAILAKGGVLLDGEAAANLSARGFDDLIGLHAASTNALPANREIIRPAAGLDRVKGRRVYNFAFAVAGSEHSSFVSLSRLRPGAESLVDFVRPGDKVISPSLVRFESPSGARVAVMGAPIAKNVSSSIFSPRKREVFRKVFEWLGRRPLDASVADEPNVLLYIHEGCGETVATVVNLRPDFIDGLDVFLGPSLAGRTFEELGEDGAWRQAAFEPQPGGKTRITGGFRPCIARIFRARQRAGGL